MQSEFLQLMQEFGFADSERPILVAVSGGVDSMVLASLLNEAGFRIAVVHCNYQLRGADSEADEKLISDWCLQNGIQIHVKRVDTHRLVEASNSSIQMIARDERYLLFEELMDAHGYPATALAHHSNDRVESLLMNVLRGTGYRGFLGMPSKRDRYVRPLIGSTKQQIREYAELKGIPFREDASNKEVYYQRNWLRLRLIPMLQAYDRNTFEKLLRFSERAENELPAYELWVEKARSVTCERNEIPIDLLTSSSAPFTIIKELLGDKGFSFGQVFEVLELTNSISGSEIRSDTHRVVKDRDKLIIHELNRSEQKPVLGYNLLNRNEVKTLHTKARVALIDADRIDNNRLKLRKWRQGDRFKPFGMQGWKLLSDFFIDEKLSILEKEQIWLLTYNDEIVWIVGHRLDDRFKVKETTQKVLKVSVQN